MVPPGVKDPFAKLPIDPTSGMPSFLKQRMTNVPNWTGPMMAGTGDPITSLIAGMIAGK